MPKNNSKTKIKFQIMQLKTMQIKTIGTKVVLAICLLLFSNASIAQEIIKDTIKSHEATKSNKKLKIDGIIATVGDYIVLDSDIDRSFLEMSSSGNSVKDITRCQMLGKLLEDKLYAHQAIQDSIKVTDSDVKGMMDERLSYMLEQLGSMDKIVKYYKKSSEEDFRTYFQDILKENKLTSEMQKKIIDAVEVTPEEVRSFFKTIPATELPLFGAEMEVSQIVIMPKVSDEEKKKVIDKLKENRSEVLAGASFKTRAVLYTADRASAPNGGFYKMNRKTAFVKEFKDVAFSLAEGEISEPFETEFGYHIINV